MRADRLLSILLLLQAHGRMSAGDLAERLEVSRRTVCRDLDALSGAGVPVVTDRGPNGGAYLLGGYRTDLTGLTEPELEALLAFGGQGPAADLGLGAQLDQASRKLAVAAGPARGNRLQERVLVDGDRWFRTAPVSPHLARVQDALWSDRRLRLRYRRGLDRVVDRVVEPYGLVCKAGTWYLIAADRGEPRLYRVSRIEGTTSLEEQARRPPGLDLDALWQQLRRRVEERGSGITVTLRVRIDQADRLLRICAPQLVGPAVRDPGDDRSGWATFQMPFVAEGAAKGVLLGFGTDVEVVSPSTLRRQFGDTAQAIASLYRDPSR